MSASAQTTSSLKQAVNEIRDRHIAAVNTGDTEAAAKLFAQAGIFLPPGAPALKGPAIQAWFETVFANFSVQGFSIDPGGNVENGDLLIEHGDWNATFVPKGASAGAPAGGTYVSVYTRLADGSVRILYDTFNGLPA